jgi:hypothetical protein
MLNDNPFLLTVFDSPDAMSAALAAGQRPAVNKTGENRITLCADVFHTY